MTDVTDIERAMLDLEGQWFKYPGAKDAQIRDQFGISPVRYYAKLSALISRPEALAYAPSTVRRLQRLEQRRRAARHG